MEVQYTSGDKTISKKLYEYNTGSGEVFFHIVCTTEKESFEQQ